MMKLTAEDARSIIYGEHPDWDVIEHRFTEHTRWSVKQTAVCQHKTTGKYYRFDYSDAATEAQDECPYKWADDPIVVPEVTPIKREITLYEPVGNSPTNNKQKGS